MNILHVSPLQWDRISGLKTCIPPLARAQNAIDGVRSAIWISLKNSQPLPEDFGVPIWQNRALHIVGGDKIDLPTPFDRPDLAVIHSTYIPKHATVGRMLRRLDIPYILCPHSGLTRFAQRRPRLKKWLGNRLFFRRLVVGSAAIHFLTDVEQQESVTWGRPSFVVGNGTDLPDLSPHDRRDDLDVSRPLRFVYVGRLHIEYKGLDLLIDACAQVAAELRQRSATVELYGPDLSGSRTTLDRRIADAGIGDVLTISSPIHGEDKSDLLARSDVFLHTSRNEGHPMAVLEALAHGLPCLLTPATTMAETVESADAGWHAKPHVESIAATLREVLQASPEQLAAKRVAARQLAERRFQWSVVAQQTVDGYRQFV